MTLTSDITDIPVSTLVADLRAARDLIAEKGLAKMSYGIREGGALCTVGAVAKVAGLRAANCSTLNGSPRVCAAVDALSETLGEDPDSTGLTKRIGIYNFNDAEMTSQDDVVGLFETTIARLR